MTPNPKSNQLAIMGRGDFQWDPSGKINAKICALIQLASDSKTSRAKSTTIYCSIVAPVCYVLKYFNMLKYIS